MQRNSKPGILSQGSTRKTQPDRPILKACCKGSSPSRRNPREISTGLGAGLSKILRSFFRNPFPFPMKPQPSKAETIPSEAKSPLTAAQDWVFRLSLEGKVILDSLPLGSSSKTACS